MTERVYRALLGLSYAVTFITVGFGIFSEPSVGVVTFIQKGLHIEPQAMAWAFILSGIVNGYMGLRNMILNPAAFAVFILYTGYTWVAVFEDPNIPVAPAAFYTLLCVVYFLGQIADRSEDSINHGGNN
jgi:hypothetical protein